MAQIKKRKTALFVFFLTAAIWLSGCDIYKEETLHISGIDEQACEALNDTTAVEYTAALATDYNAGWLNANVGTFSDSLLNYLEQDTIVIAQGNIHPYEIILPNTNDTSYIAVSVTPGVRTFFLTNIVDLLLLTPDGQPVDLLSDEMPLTLVSGCTVEDSKGNLFPQVKMRNQYDIDGDRLLLVIEKNNQTVVDAQKKVAIIRLVVY